MFMPHSGITETLSDAESVRGVHMIRLQQMILTDRACMQISETTNFLLIKEEIMGTTLGRNIKAFRKNRGLTQEELANLLNITPQAVSKWESEAGVPVWGSFHVTNINKRGCLARQPLVSYIIQFFLSGTQI